MMDTTVLETCRRI